MFLISISSVVGFSAPLVIDFTVFFNVSFIIDVAGGFSIGKFALDFVGLPS